jgi:hypothetical protein
MAEEWELKLGAALIENVPVLLILLGIILVILGLTTGIHGWIKIEFPWARVVAISLGVILMGAGVLSAPYAKRLPNAPSFKVKITHPQQGSEGHKFIMEGTIAKTKLPAGYDFRIIKLYSKGWAPLGSVRIKKDGTWESGQINIGGNPGEFISVGVYLVGPAGRVLIEYFDEASSIHEKAMKSSGPLPPGVERYLPTIKYFPADILECVSAKYKRDSTT